MLSLVLILINFFHNPELIIGEEKDDPGIVFIFEGALKDNIYPSSFHLPESQTDVHIEARVNWDKEKIPEGAVPGGFIPYMHITDIFKNSKTSLRFLIISVSELEVPGSDINKETVGAINDNPIASRSPDTTSNKDEKKTANFLFARMFLENSKRLPLFFIIIKV